MFDWFVTNKEEIGLVVMGVLAGGVAALRWVAPLTKTTLDDKALKWGKRALKALGKWVQPKEGK